MDKAHVKLGLDKMSVPDQIAEARRIAAAILNSDLADKAELAARLNAAADKLVRDDALAQGLQLQTNASFETRNGTVHELADVAEDVASIAEKKVDYNGPALQLLGFKLASTNRTSATMTKVLNLQLSPGDHPGQLHAQWQPMAGSRSYQIQYQVSDSLLMDEAQWRNADPSTPSKCDVNGLPSHQLVWIRVRAIGAGAGNIGPWSDAVSMSAQ